MPKTNLYANNATHLCTSLFVKVISLIGYSSSRSKGYDRDMNIPKWMDEGDDLEECTFAFVSTKS